MAKPLPAIRLNPRLLPRLRHPSLASTRSSFRGHLRHAHVSIHQLDAPFHFNNLILLHRVHLQTNVRQSPQYLQILVNGRNEDPKEQNQSNQSQQKRKEVTFYS